MTAKLQIEGSTYNPSSNTPLPTNERQALAYLEQHYNDSNDAIGNVVYPVAGANINIKSMFNTYKDILKRNKGNANRNKILEEARNNDINLINHLK